MSEEAHLQLIKEALALSEVSVESEILS